MPPPPDHDTYNDAAGTFSTNAVQNSPSALYLDNISLSNFFFYASIVLDLCFPHYLFSQILLLFSSFSLLLHTILINSYLFSSSPISVHLYSYPILFSILFPLTLYFFPILSHLLVPSLSFLLSCTTHCCTLQLSSTTFLQNLFYRIPPFHET